MKVPILGQLALSLALWVPLVLCRRDVIIPDSYASCEEITNPRDCFAAKERMESEPNDIRSVAACFHCGGHTFHNNLSDTSCHKWDLCKARSVCGTTHKVHTGAQRAWEHNLAILSHASNEFCHWRILFALFIICTCVCVYDISFPDLIERCCAGTLLSYPLLVYVSSLHVFLDPKDAMDRYCERDTSTFQVMEYLTIEFISLLVALISLFRFSQDRILPLFILYLYVISPSYANLPFFYTFFVNFTFISKPQLSGTLPWILVISMGFRFVVPFLTLLSTLLYVIWASNWIWKRDQTMSIIKQSYQRDSRFRYLLWSVLVAVLQVILMIRYEIINYSTMDWPSTATINLLYGIIYPPFLITQTLMLEILPMHTQEAIERYRRTAYRPTGWTRTHIVMYLSLAQLVVFFGITWSRSEIPLWCYNGVLTIMSHLMVIDMYRHTHSLYSSVVVVNCLLAVGLGVTIFCVYVGWFSISILHIFQTVVGLLKGLLGYIDIDLHRPLRGSSQSESFEDQFQRQSLHRLYEIREILTSQIQRKESRGEETIEQDGEYVPLMS